MTRDDLLDRIRTRQERSGFRRLCIHEGELIDYVKEGCCDVYRQFTCRHFNQPRISKNCPSCPEYAPQATPRGRIVIFKAGDYRRTPSDRLRDHLEKARWDVSFIDPGLRPSLPDLQSIIDNPPTAIIRWEEQGSVFKNKRWAEICAWCYANSVAPLSVDYGYFDHFRTLMLDRYLPNGSSAIAEEWDAVSDAPIDWSRAEKRLRTYVWKTRKMFDRARGMEPIVEPGYVAVFLQYSPALCRLPFADETGLDAIDKWTHRVVRTLQSAGHRVLIKKSPLNPPGSPATPPDVSVFETTATRSDANVLLNLRIAAHAKHIIMNCSSVANEFVLNDLPIVATGRSWFARAPRVFHEPEAWPGIAQCPPPDASARNKWIRWWLTHQGYADQIADRLDYVLQGFRTSRARQAPTIVSLPARAKAILANDTRREAGGKHLGCRLNMDNLERLLHSRGIEVVDRIAVGGLDSTKYWDKLAAARLVVINGEGSVHSSNNRALGIMRAVSHCRKNAVPVWLVNHLSWHNDNLLQRYSEADYVAVRDIASCGYLAEHGICAELAADCGFLSAAAQADRTNSILVCAGLAAPSPEIYERLANDAQCDIVLCNDFYGNFEAGVYSESIEDCFAKFASARFVVSSSYHGCAFAALHGVPFIPVVSAGMPPKQRIMAVEAMGFHAPKVRDTRYLIAHEAEIRGTILARAEWFRHRATLNIPEDFSIQPTKREREVKHGAK